ncbi:Flp pilus assembly protein CpaB [Marivita sp. XM-24bin2]|jgi:pilus assembly protein CpaB|uniref:Flp pilus assembly protein CpaB n=1 Tax=unclassified Marivita TaxID=2632480 RepID=UPI000D795244|nr:Flp pilus assembly protein CpaB [Marivita sp. XM-24bin2]MCR9108517.1 Flp pilus assembly protein CpaB [Paracoccaceae bacterium]PWL34698.1 MAG: Flp pilus assembly protein CpaB [Marivita sp. XM-24bin2]
MRIVFGLVLIAGLALAGFAVYMAQNYIGAYQTALEQERSKVTASVPVQEIFVATRAIDYGELISDEDIALMPWPKQTLPDQFFDAANPLNEAGAELRVALRPIEKNEAMMATKVSEPGADAGLTSRLERGQRAFAIKVDVASGVSGFLRPTDRVDVYWTGRVRSNDPNMPNGEVTKLIETGVKLIAIDQTSQTETAETTIARTVTVAASPQQVASLAQAQSTGRLSLSLMGRNDDTVADVIEVDQRSLLGLEEKKDVEKPHSIQVCTIRTRRGGEVVDMPIPCTN